MTQPASLQPVARFSDRVGDYARHRPSYPQEAIQAVLAGLNVGPGFTAVDVGAGTGISTRLLAERVFPAGGRVVAIEPNEAMREQGTASSDSRIEWMGTSGEQTGLPDRSADLVLCAQAFHWLDGPAALDEFARILKPGGRAALLWNVQDTTDEFTAGYNRALRTHAVDEPRSPTYISDPDGSYCGLPGILRDHRGFSSYAHFELRGDQTLDMEGLLGRALSASYAPKSGPGYESLKRTLAELFREYQVNGRVRLRYSVRLHRAERRA